MAKKKPVKGKASAPAKIKVVKQAGTQAYEKSLIKMRADILRLVEVNKSADLSAADVGDEADQATQSSERELQFELSDNERNSLDAVEAALTEDRHRGVWSMRIVPGENCGTSVKSDSPRALLHWVSSEV
jgi:hypothetical protein